MVYLNVEDINQLFESSLFWNTNGKAIVEFRRSDYLFNPSIPISEEVRNIVEEHTGVRPSGSVYMLTHLRYFGYIFNPVTFYYCYNKDGKTIESIVAEITNTPWKERFCYVLNCNNDTGSESEQTFDLDKIFHVSPFMDMNQHYNWRFSDPGKLLTVHMENYVKGDKCFEVSLSMKRQILTKNNLRRAILTLPFMTMQVTAGIYWQALKLWLKGAPFYPNPQKIRTDNVK